MALILATTINGGALTIANTSYNNSFINLVGGTINFANLAGNFAGNLILNGGTLALSDPGIGTIATAGTVSKLPSAFTGSITIAQGGTISTIVGSLSDYPVGPGTEITHLDNVLLFCSAKAVSARVVYFCSTAARWRSPTPRSHHNSRIFSNPPASSEPFDTGARCRVCRAGFDRPASSAASMIWLLQVRA